MKKWCLILLFLGSCYSYCMVGGKQKKLKLTRWEYTCFEWFCEQQKQLKQINYQQHLHSLATITKSYADEFEQIDAALKEYVSSVFYQNKQMNQVHIRPEDICRILLRVKLALDYKQPIDARFEKLKELSLFDHYSR